MAPGFAGKRLPCVKLMEASILQEFNLQHHRYLRKMVQFIPFSFKELADLDLLEYSALSRLNLLNYVAFGALHDQRDEFRAIKIAHKQFTGYKPGDYLPETMETNVNKKLVSGQPYEEINYNKEAAPYGSTYYLMSVIAELFLCNTQSPRFTSAQVYCYMRSLHGFKTNWAKALLHGLRTKILFLQKRARENNDKQQVIPVVWAPTFLQILYTYRQTIFAGSALSEAEGWLGWSHMSRDGDIDIHALVARFPTKMEDLREIREKCKLIDHILIPSAVCDEGADCDQPDSAPKTGTRKRPRPSSGGPSSSTQIVKIDLTIPDKEDTRPTYVTELDLENVVSDLTGNIQHMVTTEMFRFLEASASSVEQCKAKVASLTAQLQTAEHTDAFTKLQVNSLRNELDKANAEIADVWKARVGRLTLQLESADCTIADLKKDLTNLHQEVASSKLEGAKEAKAQVEAELQLQIQHAHKEATADKGAILKLEVQVQTAQRCRVVNRLWAESLTRLTYF
ncbi:hypothetical protein R1sor_014028 [Riccia sorocarpa]|uniref:Uncharacterized protein n=1 Tax=Riccia sorocarpa TaxID=122646 RepID=A0ABD3HB45_9MARC